MMNINRHNYEEYFLMLADNELSEEEKIAVEDFVKQNPDLEEELTAIKLAISKVDLGCKLANKSFLIKQTHAFISATNYEEIFLMYHDGELNVNQQTDTEAFVEKNHVFKNEFESLKKSRVEHDISIVFPDKKLLLKNEENDKVTYLKWWKVAAAAVILGVGIWTGYDLLENKKSQLPVVVKNNLPGKSKNTANVKADNKPIDSVNVFADSKPTVNTLSHKINDKKDISKAFSKEKPKESLQVVNLKKGPGNLPQPVINIESDKNEEVDFEKKPLAMNDKIDLVKNSNETNDLSKEITGNEDILITGQNEKQDAIQTSYTLDESEKSNNYAFYNVTQERFNKSKLGGLLRKVKRIIERKISPLNAAKDHSEMAVN